MNYITSAEAAKMWNVSQRRVQDYCKKGKIKGAASIGNRWLIPKNAVKPEEKVGRPRKSPNNRTV